MLSAAVNGAVIATKKMLPTSLVDESSVQHIATIADHIGESELVNTCREAVCGVLCCPSVALRECCPRLAARAQGWLPLWGLCLAGMVYSGMGADFRVLVKKGQKVAQTYWKTYGVRAVAWRLASLGIVLLSALRKRGDDVALPDGL